MRTIFVSVSSDDMFFREGLRQLIEQERAIRLVDGSASSDDARVEPDVLLVDSRSRHALEHCARASASRPFSILLSVPDDGSAVDALAVGARGIVRNDAQARDVIRAITAVHNGEVWAPRQLLASALRRRVAPLSTPATMIEERLSARECEVVRYVAAGMSNKALAELLAISAATVKAHLTRIFDKVGVRSRGELIAAYHGAAIRAGEEKRPA